jgi:hypothetical protein
MGQSEPPRLLRRLFVESHAVSGWEAVTSVDEYMLVRILLAERCQLVIAGACRRSFLCKSLADQLPMNPAAASSAYAVKCKKPDDRVPGQYRNLLILLARLDGFEPPTP